MHHLSNDIFQLLEMNEKVWYLLRGYKEKLYCKQLIIQPYCTQWHYFINVPDEMYFTLQAVFSSESAY